MRFGKTLLVTVIVGLFAAPVTRDVRASKPSLGPAPGFDSELSIVGDPLLGGIVQIVCRFSITPVAFGAIELDSLLALLTRQNQMSSVEYYADKIDSVIMSADTGIEFLTPAVWTGRIEPGTAYEFRATIRLRSEYESNVYAGVQSRFGNQSFGYVPFFFGRRPRPLGYVVDTIIDSVGNRTHRHRRVMDSLTPGFIFDTSGLPLPDTTFDSLGRVKFIIKSVLDLKSLPFQLPGPTPKVRLVDSTKQKAPMKRSGSSNQQSSIMVPDRNVSNSKVRSVEEQSSYTIAGMIKYQSAHPIAVHPDQELREFAKQQTWPIANSLENVLPNMKP